MRIRRSLWLVFLFVPLLMWLLVVTSPYYSERLSLALHGQPFARVVPKEKLDSFQFVQIDNLRCRAIVFSREKAVGWILQPMFGFARFVPFSATPNFPDIEFPDALSDLVLPVSWSCRLWLLEAQAVFLLWFLVKRRKAGAVGQGTKVQGG